ncbi:MAG: hypothetical protein K0U98_06200 [Deltaproteobacteria bacterium]|nr:hypothetical protein [Deltaproteobacteria bacterium]
MSEKDWQETVFRHTFTRRLALPQDAVMLERLSEIFSQFCNELADPELGQSDSGLQADLEAVGRDLCFLEGFLENNIAASKEVLNLTPNEAALADRAAQLAPRVAELAAEIRRALS